MDQHRRWFHGESGWGIGSEIQYLQAKTNYEAAVSAVQQAESQLAKSTIRATRLLPTATGTNCALNKRAPN